MSLAVTDEGKDGENEDMAITSDKLKTKVPDSVYNKLKEAGMDDVKTLIFTEMKDLDELCKELNFNLKEKIKFKSAIRQLKEKYGPKEQTNIIRITTNEQKK
eukprot:981842_1